MRADRVVRSIVTLTAALSAQPLVAAGAQEPFGEPAEVTCPAPLGVGQRTALSFCDVLIARDAAEGLRIAVPPGLRRRASELRFALHNRHTYSEQQVRAGTAFAHYTAVVDVYGGEGELLARAAVDSEFRTAEDLVDRVGGGAGPEGMKAVAPTGTERVIVRLPANVAEVFIVGERLTIERLDGLASFSTAGRPIAVISDVRVGPAIDRD